MATKIAAGIIGTGFIGPAHVEAGRRLGNIDFIKMKMKFKNITKRHVVENLCL